MRHYYSPKRRIGQKFRKGETLEKRLEDFGVTGIIGQAEERKAKKEPPSEIDSRALFKEKLREINALMVQAEKIEANRKKIEARRYAHEKKLGDKMIRKSDKRKRVLLRREIVFTEKIKEEARRIFAAKPYDPHKTERNRVKWK
jgi:hypothetical protein